MNPRESFASLRKLADGVTNSPLGGLVTDLRVAICFYTTLPLPAPTATIAAADGTALARASWCVPLVGALIGAIAALAYWVAIRLNLPPVVAATLAVGAGMLTTGCLHEDGLADTADGFGGETRERRLEIMRDGRIGAFGACALVMAIALRVGALADLPNPELVAWALVGAHAAARAGLPLFMRLVPPARTDGLSAAAGAPPLGRAIAALAIGVDDALITVALLLAAGIVMAWLCRRRIGGQTGDTLGALEQVWECLVLLVTAARF